ncbi:CD99 molecule isoform X2 [Sinocyclocheilus grahami]|uniref:CD99 antigen-like protein 2 n=1 Tax=Sinocyclocheilus grahami TaxID=75366 RepID=A0A672KX62_SINGR|nr:PREDICTED: CD99 antigen-like protein 2 isoform X2 [Sinocyclocheilus grahami]
MSRIAKINSATSIALVTGDIKDCMIPASWRKQTPKMTSHTWILLLLASLVATRAQDLNLADAFDDDGKPPAKPTVKPAPPKNPDSGFDLSDVFDLDPKTPAVVPPKSEDDKKEPSGGDFDLSDAFGPDTEPKKPVVPPKDRGTGGGTFDDKDLFDVKEGGEYQPDGGQSGGRGADIPDNDQNGGASEQPQDLNHQWLQIIKMLVDNIPEGLSVWVSQFNQVVEPLLEQLWELLNVTEEKAEL